MKKINLKIVLAIVLCSALGLVINGLINLQISSSVVRDKSVDELEQFIKRERVDFECKLVTIERAAAVMEGVIRTTFDMRQIESEEYIDRYIIEHDEIFAGIAREMELLNIYAYFNPAFYKRGQSSIADLDQSGNYVKQPKWDLHKVDEATLKSDEYAWYSKAVETGEHWTSPFFWDKYKMKLITYTRAIYVNDTLLAVVGSDMNVNEIIDYFASEEMEAKGNIFVLDNGLNFIFEEGLEKTSLKDVSPEGYKAFRKGLENKAMEGSWSYDFEGKRRVLFYEVLKNGWIVSLSIVEDDIWSELKGMVLVFWLLLFAVIAGSAVIALFTARSISGPVKSISNSMERISTGDGDLTQRLDVKSKDEVGVLASRFNLFLDRLKEIVEGARKSAGNDKLIVKELQEAVSDSSSAINRISNNINSIKGQIAGLDNNIYESTTSIEEVSANLSSINSQVSSQGAAVEQSTAAIEEMISSLNNVVHVTQRKLQAIEELVGTVRQGGDQLRITNETFGTGVAKRITEITEMVKVINSISAQTNLLAMNASIEAAHAGESGRGFAVVAEEIRAMAETSAESARNISQIINQIVESIKETADSAEKTSHAFVEIDKEVLDFKGAFQEIASSTSEISVGGNEVLKAVTELNQITSHIMTGIKEIDKATSQVRGTMLDVKQISSDSLGGINEISKGTGYVEESVYRVSRQAEELAGETEVLLKELNRFKTS